MHTATLLLVITFGAWALAEQLLVSRARVQQAVRLFVKQKRTTSLL